MSINTTIQMTPARLTQLAQQQKQYLKDKSITRNGKPVGLMSCLQMICQSHFNKPYEEVKVLLASAGTLMTTNDVSGVYLFHYNADIVLATFDEGAFTLHYVRDRGTGSDIELTTSELKLRAELLANTRNCQVIETYLPPILGQNWEYEDVFALAEEMGYGRRDSTLLDALEACEGPIFIDNMHCQYAINSDWRVEVEGLGDAFAEDADEENPRDHTAWMVDIEIGMELYEFYFSLRDLMQAQRVEGKKNTWTVVQGEHAYTITFYES